MALRRFAMSSVLLFAYVAVSSIADFEVSPEAFAADDECAASEAVCALNALQLKKTRAVVEVEDGRDEPEKPAEGDAEEEEKPPEEDAAAKQEKPAEEDAEEEKPAEEDAEEEEEPDSMPDISTGFDETGPYDEEPDEAEATKPRAAIEGWNKAADLGDDLGASMDSSWGQTFCQSHHTGYFCDSTTRIRCCQQGPSYVKCGSTWHSSSCGWHGGGGDDRRRRSYYGGDDRRRRSYYGGGSGGGWHIHSGWHQSSFCTSHHVGYFCSQHKKVHCCNDYGHFVECTTHTESTRYC